MRVIRGLHNVQSADQGGVGTVGTFDGIHLGHQQILSKLIYRANQLGTHPVVILFEPQPNEYFCEQDTPPRLTNLREKLLILEDLGIRHVLCVRFDERLRQLEAESFIRNILVRSLKIQYLVVGRDFKFGRNTQGDFSVLAVAASKLGFGLDQVSDLELQQQKISSTRLRNALSRGDFSLAESCLGRPYFMQGRVTKGRQVGTTLGVPTVNIPLARARSPLEGVFAVTVDGLESTRIGAAYIGSATNNSMYDPILEVHIFDFAENIYGRDLRITFLKKFREDRQFDSSAVLREHMLADIYQIKRWIQTTFSA